MVSTHSRPKAAASASANTPRGQRVSTHSRPKAADGDGLTAAIDGWVSTHSRPKAAGAAEAVAAKGNLVSTHSRPKAAVIQTLRDGKECWFQHTAARRRLGHWWRLLVLSGGFNTQPPEGGCHISAFIECASVVSTHSHPKAAGTFKRYSLAASRFQHTAARRRLRTFVD